MKLTTDIKPRKDGTVTAKANGNIYVFAAGADGRLVADVQDVGDIGFLLDSGNFYPAGEEDIGAGLEVVKSQATDGQVATEVLAVPVKPGKSKKK